MRYKLFVLLLLLSCALSSLAADFNTEFEKLASSQKLNEVRILVASETDAAELLFRQYLGVLLKQPDAEKEKTNANILARALLFAEIDIPTRVLADSRLLLPETHWDGTALAESKRPGPSPEAIAKKKAQEEAIEQNRRQAREDFINRFDSFERDKDWVQIARLTQFDPALSQELFDERYAAFRKNSNDSEAKASLNLLARAMLINGNDRATETLLSEGHLFPSNHWNNSILEDDERLRNKPNTIARNMDPAGSSAADNTKAAFHLAISVGNLEAAKLLLAEIQDSENRKLLECIAYESAGLSQKAQQAANGLPTSAYLECCQVMAARQSLATDKLSTHLDVLERELNNTEDPSSQIGQFVLDSQRFWLQSLQEKPDFDIFLERHQRAWRHLDGLEVRGLESGYGRWLTRSAWVWIEQAQKMSDAEAKEYPHRAQLQYLIAQDLEKIETMNQRALEESFRLQPAEPTQFKELWNPEFFLGLFELRLNLVQYHRDRGNLKEAKKQLEALKPLRLTLYAKFQEANLAYQASSLKYGPMSPLLFSWFEGHVLRLLGRYHSQLAHLWLQSDNFGTKAAYETEEELSKARQFQEQSKGDFGLDDWKWTLLSYQVEQNPQGWESEAPGLSQELLSQARSSGSRPAVLEALRLQAKLQGKQKKFDSAIKSLEEAVELVEKISSETGSGFRDQYRTIYEQLAELYLEQGREAEAFDLLGRGAQVQQIVTRAKRVLSLEREREEAAAAELQAAKNSGASGPLEEKMLASSQAEFYSAMRKLRAENPTFGSRLAIRPVSFSRVQKLLPPKTALIQYFPSPEALYIFVIDRENFTVHQVPVTEQKLTSLVRRFRRDIQRVSPLRKESGELFDLLLKPVEAKWKDQELLVFVPTGNLFYLPFAALTQEVDGKKTFLIESHQIATISKSSDLLALSSKPFSGSTSVLALGNPDGTLPGAEEEVAKLKELFPDLRLAAKDRTVLDKLGKANTLHLATHGVVNKEEPLESYLVLEGEDRLTLADISGTDLSQLHLVTLSACETAISSEKGDQGEIATLADSFSFAGVPTLIASLWKVSDESTGQLMLSFYGHLKDGKSVALALTLAQRELIKSRATEHPYFWAPFMVMGDWR